MGPCDRQRLRAVILEIPLDEPAVCPAEPGPGVEFAVRLQGVHIAGHAVIEARIREKTAGRRAGGLDLLRYLVEINQAADHPAAQNAEERPRKGGVHRSDAFGFESDPRARHVRRQLRACIGNEQIGARVKVLENHEGEIRSARRQGIGSRNQRLRARRVAVARHRSPLLAEEVFLPPDCKAVLAARGRIRIRDNSARIAQPFPEGNSLEIAAGRRERLKVRVLQRAGHRGVGGIGTDIIKVHVLVRGPVSRGHIQQHRAARDGADRRNHCRRLELSPARGPGDAEPRRFSVRSKLRARGIVELHDQRAIAVRRLEVVHARRRHHVGIGPVDFARLRVPALLENAGNGAERIHPHVVHTVLSRTGVRHNHAAILIRAGPVGDPEPALRDVGRLEAVVQEQVDLCECGTRAQHENAQREKQRHTDVPATATEKTRDRSHGRTEEYTSHCLDSYVLD